jgi:hypothetical protein
MFKSFVINDVLTKIVTAKAQETKDDTADTIWATTAGWANNNLTKRVKRQGATILKNAISITANGSGKAFYQSQEFTVLQDSYAVKLKPQYEQYNSKHVLLYLVSALNKTIVGKYNFTNKSGWNRVKHDVVELPTSTSGQIDFAYMEDYMRKLELARIHELKTYLKTTGLTDYKLTSTKK